MQVPEHYVDREQSFLKHRVLEEYVVSWALKLGSAARDRPVRLCYLDGFAGPWMAKSAELEDTSIAVGLGALESALTRLTKDGVRLAIEARFIETNATAFRKLDAYVRAHQGGVSPRADHGEFGDFVPELQRWLGSDAALIFVDPTGWKGAAMRFIRPLVARRPRRDVLVNVMFDHINRFKDDTRRFLRDQMREFFGLGRSALPPALTEEELFGLYRSKLKEVCEVEYAADLAIPHPTIDRTKFRLVVGGKNPAILELFRQIEKKVIGAEAAEVREGAAIRKSERASGQLNLLAAPPQTDLRYDSLHDFGLRDAPSALLASLSRSGPKEFREVWPQLLEVHHITKTELASIAWGLVKNDAIEVMNLSKRERTVHDHHKLKAT